jgi:hypothetical protein
MNGEGGTVYRTIPFNNFSFMANEQKIGHFNLTEMHPKWIHPEQIEMFRVPSCNVAGYTFIEAEL